MRRGAGLRDARPGSPFFIRRHAGGARIARRLRDGVLPREMSGASSGSRRPGPSFGRRMPDGAGAMTSAAADAAPLVSNIGGGRMHDLDCDTNRRLFSQTTTAWNLIGRP